jgi:TonB family protein
LIAGIILFEGVFNGSSQPAMQSVELITPGEILGDLPKGPGHGLGQYTPPTDAGPPEASLPAPSDKTFTPEESTAPVPTPKPAVTTASDPNEIKIPKKTALKKPAAAAAVKPATTAKPTVQASAAPSASDIRRRLAAALKAAEGSGDGTPSGDGKPAGGGTGELKYGRLGSPDGSPFGVAGGRGKGTPFWWYYQQVHDRMYEAWEQPGQALNWDKKIMATVLIRVARDGTITDVSLKMPSGNKIMDDSALQAARKVQRLDPLPEGLGGATADITVNFQLEG